MLDDADLMGAALDGVDLEGASVTGTILNQDDSRSRGPLPHAVNGAPVAH